MLDEFIANLHPSTKILSRGTATVMGNKVDSVLVRNLYGQEIVWGVFNVERGKYKGKKLTNSAATEEVVYLPDPL
jgi:hypothetical protein